jgi:PKHD-type hydroxylase
VRDTGIRRTSETAWVYEAVASALDECNREHFGFDLEDFSEAIAIVDYGEGDFFDWHLDLGPGVRYRKLAATVMLSAPEDYEGGALAFPGQDFDRIARGSAIVFPSFLLHAVRPVTRGRRCTLVAWAGGPRFR